MKGHQRPRPSKRKKQQEATRVANGGLRAPRRIGKPKPLTKAELYLGNVKPRNMWRNCK